jgi:hypothetical protein
MIVNLPFAIFNTNTMLKTNFPLHKQVKNIYDPNLCGNATEDTNNHEYKDTAEITLHFINIKELKFVYRHNRNKLVRVLVAYLLDEMWRL